MRNGMRTNGGFMRAIVTIVLALVVLKYAFRIDALDVFNHPRFDPFFDKLYANVWGIWEKYLLPAMNVVVRYGEIAWEYASKAFAAVIGYLKGPVYKMFHTIPNS